MKWPLICDKKHYPTDQWREIEQVLSKRKNEGANKENALGIKIWPWVVGGIIMIVVFGIIVFLQKSRRRVS